MFRQIANARTWVPLFCDNVIKNILYPDQDSYQGLYLTPASLAIVLRGLACQHLISSPCHSYLFIECIVIIYYSKALYNVPVVNDSIAIQSVLFGQYGTSTVCHHSYKDTQSPPNTHCPRTKGFNIYTVLGLRVSAQTLSIRYRGSGEDPLYLILIPRTLSIGGL